MLALSVFDFAPLEFYLDMSRLFYLGDDNFCRLLSWLDISSICSLDIAVGNEDERSMWLHSLHSIDSESVDEYEHCHASVRWLIMRGARATSISARRSDRTLDNQITDETFAGVGVLFTENMDLINRGFSGLSGTNFNASNGLDRAIFVRKQSWSPLTLIDLSNCRSISDAGVSAIAQGCPQLTSIDLSNNDIISDVGVSAIAKGCPLLTSIDLFGCLGISDFGVSALARGCYYLRLIELGCLDNISDISLLAIAEGCPYLAVVNLHYCRLVSDAGVLAIAQGCRKLTYINLIDCHSVSDVSLLAIAEGCPNLTDIDLNCNLNISAAGVSAIAEGCPHVNDINLQGCNRVLETAVSSLRVHYPHLRIYYRILMFEWIEIGSRHSKLRL